MAGESENQSFIFNSMDWDAYTRFRPVYPAELYSQIFAYHDFHAGAYDAAIDVGAGIGIVSAQLVKKFSHVTITDPSETYISQAKSHFTNAHPGQISYLQTRAEDIRPQKIVDDRKFDMVTAAECLHWVDVETALPRIASILKPGATLAVWLYGVRPVLEERSGDLSEAREIFYEIYDEMNRRFNEQIEKPHVGSGGAAMNSRLDHMPLPSHVWTDVRRIHAKTQNVMAHAVYPLRPSKVTDDEKVEEFANQQLLYHNADYDYLEGYLVNWIPPIKAKEFAKTKLGQLREAMSGQKIGVTWPLVLVLATRK